jgi:steroid 5-alpha reductase family enzyme
MNAVFQVSVVVFLFMTVLFFIAWLKEDNSIVDIFWGQGFILIAFYSIFSGGPRDVPKLILTLLTVVWGSRLAIHVFFRNRGRGEDFRYLAWRKSWKYFRLRSFFQVFMLQGFFMVIISFPVYHSNFSMERGFAFTDILGIIVWTTGFLFEAIGDAELVRFRKNPANAGKIITTGLWQFTRHPNYFGEALIWWGIALIGCGYPGGGWSFIPALVITLLLRFVSGVPMLEKKYEGREDWEEYKKKTPPFVPFLKFL